MSSTTRIHRHSGKQRGQSLLELALFLPILLILLSGLVEFGFLLNEYLNLMDGPREGARFGVDFDPWTETKKDNAVFYDAVAQTTIETIDPIKLHLSVDDIVISVFKLNGTTVQSRHPTDSNVVSYYAGQWSMRWWCNNYYGTKDSTTVAASLGVYCTGASGNPLPIESRFTTEDINNLIKDKTANSMGAVLVEIFYGYDQMLELPWVQMFVQDPIPVSSYTIMPVPAAEPKETPTTTP